MKRLRPDPSVVLLQQFDQIVALLRDGEASQAVFFAAIDRHKAAIRHISATNVALVERLVEAEEALALDAARMHVTAEMAPDAMQQCPVFVFRLELDGRRPVWSMPVRDGQIKVLGKERVFRRMRWRTYMNFCRVVRASLNRSFEQLIREIK